MKQINKVLLKIKLKKFRMYSQTTDGGGATGTTGTDSGQSRITSSGTADTVWYGDSNKIWTSMVQSDTGWVDHDHFYMKDQLKHGHTLSLSISDSGHTHNFSIGNHTHGISPGIYEASSSPSSFTIYVGNTEKTTISSTNYEADITQWLLNSNGTIPRNSWIEVTIVPNTLAYVVSSVFVQGFVQSRGGGNY